MTMSSLTEAQQTFTESSAVYQPGRNGLPLQACSRASSIVRAKAAHRFQVTTAGQSVHLIPKISGTRRSCSVVNGIPVPNNVYQIPLRVLQNPYEALAGYILCTRLIESDVNKPRCLRTVDGPDQYQV